MLKILQATTVHKTWTQMREVGYQGDATKTALDGEMPKAIPCLPSCFAESQLSHYTMGQNLHSWAEIASHSSPADEDAGSTSKTYFWCLLFRGVWSQELDSMILICPFQLGMLCDSMTSGNCAGFAHKCTFIHPKPFHFISSSSNLKL